MVTRQLKTVKNMDFLLGNDIIVMVVGTSLVSKSNKLSQNIDILYNAWNI